MKHSRRFKRTAFGTMLLTSTVLLFMMMAGNALAATDNVFVHGQDGADPIILRNHNGDPITYPGDCTATTAFSAKGTCGFCHDGTAGATGACGRVLLSYDQIEQHSYHAQIGANDLSAWKSTNAKPWVQSNAHFGKW